MIVSYKKCALFPHPIDGSIVLIIKLTVTRGQWRNQRVYQVSAPPTQEPSRGYVCKIGGNKREKEREKEKVKGKKEGKGNEKGERKGEKKRREKKRKGKGRKEGRRHEKIRKYKREITIQEWKGSEGEARGRKVKS